MSVAWVVLVLGVSGSVVGAAEWQSHVRTQQQTELRTATNSASATLTTELQRDEDLIRTVRALVASNPNVSNTELQDIFDNLGPKNYAGTLGLAFIERVPASQLASYQATVSADPLLGLPMSGRFALDPAGNRPQYCLGRLSPSIPPELKKATSGVSPVAGVTIPQTSPGYSIRATTTARAPSPVDRRRRRSGPAERELPRGRATGASMQAGRATRTPAAAARW